MAIVSVYSPLDFVDARGWLRKFVDRTQVLEVQIDADLPLDGLAPMRAALDALPALLGSEMSSNVMTSVAAILGAVGARLGVREHRLVKDMMSASDPAQFVKVCRCFIDRLSAEKECRGVALPIPKDTPAKRALSCIYQRFQESNLRVEDAAHEVGISPSRLSHLIKAETGFGFMAHLWRTRASHAVDLLMNSRLRIKEISNCVGFSSTTQMDRHFSYIYGRSPRTFRQDNAKLPHHHDYCG